MPKTPGLLYQIVFPEGRSAVKMKTGEECNETPMLNHKQWVQSLMFIVSQVQTA
jgi:hypothetical protein